MITAACVDRHNNDRSGRAGFAGRAQTGRPEVLASRWPGHHNFPDVVPILEVLR